LCPSIRPCSPAPPPRVVSQRMLCKAQAARRGRVLRRRAYAAAATLAGVPQLRAQGRAGTGACHESPGAAQGQPTCAPCAAAARASAPQTRARHCMLPEKPEPSQQHLEGFPAERGHQVLVRFEELRQRGQHLAVQRIHLRLQGLLPLRDCRRGRARESAPPAPRSFLAGFVDLLTCKRVAWERVSLPGALHADAGAGCDRTDAGTASECRNRRGRSRPARKCHCGHHGE